MNTQATQTANVHSACQTVLYMALELAEKEWKVGFSDGRLNPRIAVVPARDLDKLYVEIERARVRFELPKNHRVVCCYEAGRDGFWLHRKLSNDGFESIVVDPASIEVNRRRRRAKTDRIDVRMLMNRLIRHHLGEPGVWSVVHVPGVDDEDARELHRELQTLQKEINQHRHRITSLLVKQGVTVEITKTLPDQLKHVRLWDGGQLSPLLVARLNREFQRLQQAQQQRRELEAQRRQLLKEPTTERLEKVAQLQQLSGIGEVGAWLLVMEFFGWRKFKNRKQVGAAAGLTGTPYDSGESEREQGISKAGNKRVRSLMVELAWCWLRWQPHSHHTTWFNERFGTGRRLRKVGIVALARRLLIDLWRFVERGVVPEGALLKA